MLSEKLQFTKLSNIIFCTNFLTTKPLFFVKIMALGLILFVSACSSDPYLYDRTGFDQGTRPIVAANPKSPIPNAPDYYRQPYQQNYQQGYQQQPQMYASPPPVYQQPVYAPPPNYPPQYQGGGGSRYYSNPYAMPPSTYYQRYDGDQYYVPPTYYNNVETPPKQLNQTDLSY